MRARISSFIGYLGGMPGTNTGFIYNTQEPALPFNTRFHFRSEADDTSCTAVEWDGREDWVDAGFVPVPTSSNVAAVGVFVEMCFAWADIGAPIDLAMHLGIMGSVVPMDHQFSLNCSAEDSIYWQKN